jgi:class 3 adenylate cyclase
VDHARAAVDTALGIQRRAGELGRELAAQLPPLSMHVGINTGVTSLGATKIEGSAGTRWTYTASGLTTNIAARLAALAGEGEVVMSEATHAGLAGAVPSVDLGLQILKNVETPVRAFRLKSGGATPLLPETWPTRLPVPPGQND